ncbi:MAG TPA: hypothetical protein VLV50_02495 [Stellaceae bacterium]|nr:hypothetical protein [Stellaceae bacterium]
MRRRFIYRSLLLLAVLMAMPGSPRADDVKTQDSLVGKLVAPGGPDILNFRGAGLKPIRLRPATPPAAQFDIEFGAHATDLSPQGKELIRAHRADFAAKPDDATRFVITASGAPDGTSENAQKRAGSVRDYIVKEFGVDPSRIEIAALSADVSTPADALHVHVAKFAQ